MLGHSFINGKVVKTEKATIPVDDVGLLRCFSIYEGITTVGTKPAFLKEHLDRLERSAKLLGMQIPYTRIEIEKIVNDLALYVNSSRGDIRVVLTGGRSEDGITPGKGSFYAIVNDLSPLPKEYYENGVAVMLYEHQRFLPQCKTTHYTTAAMLQSQKKEVGAVEILYTKDGKVLEASTCNVFTVKNGVILTPENNILHGITRMQVLDLLEHEHMDFECREVSLEELLEADEVFLTSSYKDVLPVTRIGTSAIKSGGVGPLTNRVMQLYQDRLLNGGSGMVVSSPANLYV